MIFKKLSNIINLKNSKLGLYIKQKKIIPKISCIFLAVVLWTYVNGKKIGEKKFKVPIAIVNLSPDLVVSDIQKKYVTVTAQGKRDELDNILKRNIKLSVNLSNPVLEKIQKYPLELNNLELPENIQFTLSSTSVFVKVERILNKKVPVQLDLTGSIDDSFIQGEIQVFPDNVMLSGPESLIKDISFINTKKFSLNNIKKTTKFKLGFDLSPESNIKTNIKTVSVKIPVFNKSELSKVTRDIIVKNPPEEYDYELLTKNVDIYFIVSNPEYSLEDETFSPFVDFSILKNKYVEWENSDNIETQSIKVNIELLKSQSGIQVIKIIPDTIKVEFK